MESVKSRIRQRTNEETAVAPSELFFDLVFVFALTQVTAELAKDLTVHGLIRGLLVLSLLWWSWVGYSWLCNVVHIDEGGARLSLFGAMVAMFMLALAIPEAFEDLPGGLHGPLVLAACYFAFHALHLVLFWLIADGDRALRKQLIRFAPSMLGATAFLVLAAVTDGTMQTLMWFGALVTSYLITYLGGASGWRIGSAQHFAERHSLILIVALGESIIAIGVGATHLPISWPIVLASALGLAITAGLWQIYFGFTAHKGEHTLVHAPESKQAEWARDGYSFLHMPMITGVVLLALGLKKVLEYVGDSEHHDLSDPLKWLAVAALYGGVALYLLAQVAFEMRMLKSFNRHRLGAAVVVLLLIPLAGSLPALAALAILAAAVVALVLAETYGPFKLESEPTK